MEPMPHNTAKSKCAGGQELVPNKHGSMRVSDPVNPAYYKGDYVMRIAEDFNLSPHLFMVLKYILRAGNKPVEPELQELKKAAWYLNRKIDNLSLKE